MARFLGLDELFEWRHFDPEIVIPCVRWHLLHKGQFNLGRLRRRDRHASAV